MKNYNTFSNFGSLLKGRLLSHIESRQPIITTGLEKKVEEYTLVKKIKDSSNDTFRVGLYRDARNKKFIIKKLKFRYKNLFYILLWNEISMLSLFNMILKKYKGGILFPTLNKVIVSRNAVWVVRQFLEGRPLKLFSGEEKIETFEKIMNELRIISARISRKESYKLPRRTPLQIQLLFPFYFLISVVKQPAYVWKYLRLLFSFYSSSAGSQLFSTDFVLSHRDLTSENIFIRNGKAQIIDCETFMLCESETELALFARYYMNELKTQELITFLRKKLFTHKLKKDFTRLTIFYTFQFLSSEPKGAHFYNEALDYSEFLQTTILPNIFKEKDRPAEMANKAGLSIFGTVSRLFNIKSKEPLILCFHSIDDYDWRFSTSIKEFEEQIQFIAKNNRVVSLQELCEKRQKNTVAITFDDGYEDVLTNAAPILKKYKIMATLFAIGQPEKAERTELGNSKKLLSYEQLKKLKKAGWEIGFHTATHKNLSKLNSSELEKEIVLGKRNLESKIGSKVRYFAYPRGMYTDQVIEMVRKAGFEAAFTVDAGNIQNSSVYKMSRISLEKDLSANQFFALQTPIGRKFQSIYMTILKLKEQSIYKFSHNN